LQWLIRNIVNNTYLLDGALTAEEVMGGDSPPDFSSSDEPSNRELLEYLGLDADEIDEAMIGIEEADVKNGKQRFDSKYDTTKKKDTKQGSFWSGSNSAYNYSRCSAKHDGSEYIYKVGKITIGGARGSDLDGKYPALVIDLAGIYCDRVDRYRREMDASKNFIKFGPERFDVLRDHVIKKQQNLIIPEILRLDWPDMKEPPVTLEFWLQLWELLPDGHTLFTCVGGHGRTGTALAAMMLVDDHKMSVKDAMDIVRKLHCSHAIETVSQEDYLKEIADQRGSSNRRKGK
jgi:hypothetical protein